MFPIRRYVPPKVELRFNSTDFLVIAEDANERDLIRIAKHFNHEYDDKNRVKIINHPNVTPKVLAYLLKTSPKHFVGTLDLTIRHPLSTYEILLSFWETQGQAHHVSFYLNYKYGYDFLWKGLENENVTIAGFSQAFFKENMQKYPHDEENEKKFFIKLLHKAGHVEVTSELPLRWIKEYYNQVA